MAAQLRRHPAEREEAERGERQRHAHGGDDQAELERAERQREPRRLVVEELVVHAHVERQPEHEHEDDQLDRPPAVDRERDDEWRERRDEARLDASGQRVRHVRRAKACAAYFAPAIVSAAGNAHWPATPAIASVRRSSASSGTVESLASTIQRACVRSRCSSTSARRSGSWAKPRRNPVAAITWKPGGGSSATGTSRSHSRPGG